MNKLQHHILKKYFYIAPFDTFLRQKNSGRTAGRHDFYNMKIQIYYLKLTALGAGGIYKNTLCIKNRNSYVDWVPDCSAAKVG